MRLGAKALLIVLALASLVFGTGCTPQTRSSNGVIVIPGYGVSNKCAIGMTLSQIRKAMPDAAIIHRGLIKRVLEKDAPVALMPSVGAIAAVGADQPMSAIEFYVKAYRAEMVPELEIKAPFRGGILAGPSFEEHEVDKKQVIAAFGSAERTVTNWKDSVLLRNRGVTFIHKRPNGNELISYPSRGIAFSLKSNVVTSFEVFSPIKASSQ